MAHGPELADFAREHGPQLVAVRDLVAYRLRSAGPVRTVAPPGGERGQ
jgi:hypothetical protein